LPSQDAILAPIKGGIRQGAEQFILRQHNGAEVYDVHSYRTMGQNHLPNHKQEQVQ
jgi:hypothetical protein